MVVGTYSHRISQIGIDRILRLKWLEKTAYLVLAGNNSSTIRIILQAEISDSFQSANTKVRGALNKTITNLMKIWVNPPEELMAFHADGLQFLKQLPSDQKLAIHWGMTMAVYPFWAKVASHVGRILKLQESFQIRSIQRRLREQYGQRETVSRAAQRIVRSFVDWEVLKGWGRTGIYTRGKSFELDNPKVIAWLIESYLYTLSNGVIPLRTLINATCFFPFRMQSVTSKNLMASTSRLDIVRHDLDHELVVLKKSMVQK